LAGLPATFCNRACKLSFRSVAATAALRDVLPGETISTPMNSTMGTVRPRHKAQKAVRNDAFIMLENPSIVSIIDRGSDSALAIFGKTGKIDVACANGQLLRPGIIRVSCR
jgi:hypothetical protein